MDKKQVSLSYLLVTKDRLPFLKITLTALLTNLAEDEEVIVIDGNSSDGTQEYLQQFFNAGKIHQYVSEPDRNQAHAWNKAMLMAKGTLIKKIIDDDVYDHAAIRKCKNFMLDNSGVDICVSNDLETNLNTPTQIKPSGRLPEYMAWKNGEVRSFTFSDISILVRRSSLSFLGLYDVQFKMMDWEYALRVSYLQAKIAYFTGYNAMGVATPGNVTSTATAQLLNFEGSIGMLKYDYKGDKADISLYSHIKIWLGSFYAKHFAKQKSADFNSIPVDAELQKLYTSFYSKLIEHNDRHTSEFIY